MVRKLIQPFPIAIADADIQLTYKAANLKEKKLSYADVYAAALAIQKKAILITGDKEYDKLIGEANFKVKYL